MTPEQKIVSLETAKKLKEAGFPQSTERYWYRMEDGAGGYTDWSLTCVHSWNKKHGMADQEVAAPDAQEIGEELPELIEKGWLELEAKSLLPDGDGDVWGVCYVDSDFERKANGHMGLSDKKMVSPMFYHENEAEARAAAWLWLKENNLL